MNSTIPPFLRILSLSLSFSLSLFPSVSVCVSHTSHHNPQHISHIISLSRSNSNGRLQQTKKKQRGTLSLFHCSLLLIIHTSAYDTSKFISLSRPIIISVLFLFLFLFQFLILPPTQAEIENTPSLSLSPKKKSQIQKNKKKTLENNKPSNPPSR